MTKSIREMTVSEYDIHQTEWWLAKKKKLVERLIVKLARLSRDIARLERRLAWAKTVRDEEQRRLELMRDGDSNITSAITAANRARSEVLNFPAI